MPYTVYERKRQRLKSAGVSLQRLGRIVLNKLAAQPFTEQAAENALLLWDADNRRFAIRPIFKRDPRAYPIRFGKIGSQGNQEVATINAKSFLDDIGVDYSETRQYPAQWNEQEGILEVPLPEERFKAGREGVVRLNPRQNRTA